MDRRVVVRALLTSIALVILLPVGLVVAAGFLPDVPAVGRFGSLLSVGLGWIVIAILGSTLLTALAVWLGGRRFTLMLLAGSLAASLGAGVVAFRYAAFAAANGATFDIARGLAPESATPTADAVFTYPTADPTVQLLAALWRVEPRLRIDRPSGSRAIVYVHGGAFVGGGLNSRSHLFNAWSSAGIAVLDVEYRLAPPPRWADAPGDVLCGLAFLRTIATAEGIDPDAIVVMGESAGGSLALLAAYAAGTDQLPSSCAGDPLVPAGVIAVAPAADLAGIWQDSTLVAADLRFPEAYVGGTPSEVPDRYAMASPFRLIRAGLPPTLLIAGENDHLVLFPRVISIFDALKAAGTDVRLLIVPFAEHGFDGLPNAFGAQMEESIVPAFVAEVTS